MLVAVFHGCSQVGSKLCRKMMSLSLILPIKLWLVNCFPPPKCQKVPSVDTMQTRLVLTSRAEPCDSHPWDLTVILETWWFSDKFQWRKSKTNKSKPGQIKAKLIRMATYHKKREETVCCFLIWANQLFKAWYQRLPQLCSNRRNDCCVFLSFSLHPGSERVHTLLSPAHQPPVRPGRRGWGDQWPRVCSPLLCHASVS